MGCNSGSSGPPSTFSHGDEMARLEQEVGDREFRLRFLLEEAYVALATVETNLELCERIRFTLYPNGVKYSNRPEEGAK